MTRQMLLAAASALSLAGPALAQPVEQGPKNVPEFEPVFENQTRAPALDSGVTLEIEEIATDLVHPWGLEVLPDGGYLVTERIGQLRHIAADGTVGAPIEGLPEILSQEQGGLLDIALAQDFAETRVIYLTYSKPVGDGMSATAAARAVLSEDMSELTEVSDIFVQEPPSPSPMHYGSRVVLDGEHAFVTTGEHFTEDERVYAQDLDKTYGKIVRVTLDGEAPDDNPFVGQADAIDSIWSYGHRNIQGAALHPETGELWALEHGPQGGDELNLVEAGANYGWPVVSYGLKYSGEPVGNSAHSQEGIVEPRYYWDPVIAPGGFGFVPDGIFSDWQGDVVIASLVPGGLVRLTLDGDSVTGEERFLGEELGRVRDIEFDADGAILAITDTDSGRLVRLTPSSG